MQLRTGILSFLLCATIWWLLSDGAGWYIGLVVVTLATVLFVRLGILFPRLHWRFMPPFLLFVGKTMWLGGWDVARRAISPRMVIDPAWTTYRFTSLSPSARVFLSALIGLMPGTLSSKVVADDMILHVLDQRHDWAADIRRLEQLLGQLLREDVLP